jgi:hypothetical protein
MAWLTTAQFREKFSLAANRFETQIAAASASAALIIQRGVDSDIYAEAINATPPSDPDELIRYSSVVEAHSFLTMWFLVGNVGNKLGDSGFVKQAQDASSPATSQTITNQYLTPKDLEFLRKGLFENANLYIGPYGTIDITIDVAEEESSLAISSLKWF